VETRCVAGVAALSVVRLSQLEQMVLLDFGGEAVDHLDDVDAWPGWRPPRHGKVV
jgi:hypothetical protein